MNSEINSKLQASRKELLDIGLRNNLISFKKTGKNLTLLPADAPAVLEALCFEERALAFAAAEKHAVKGGDATIDKAESTEDAAAANNFELLRKLSHAPAPSESTHLSQTKTSRGRKPSGLQLQTAMDEERLFLQLLKIQAEAQTYVEEQGVNILFIALGFLHWYESDSSIDARRAPLVLIPVSLTRASAQESFKVAYTGDDLIFNLSLAAKLKTDFGLVLPEQDEKSEFNGEALSRYFKDVAQSVKIQKRWSVQSDELVLGFFSFGKFLMFKDLDPQSWPDNKAPECHPVMSRLLGAGFGENRPAYEDDVNVDSVTAPGEVHFVKDADSSQTQAILEVRAGSNLVIQGPPGTGKSQTITNLIAELISQNKTVLFVSEKMAALEVVKRRLDECHLGDAALELHSQRATKTSVLNELARSLDQGKPLNDKGDRDIENLKRVQDNLNQYCNTVSTTVGHSGLPFLDVLGRYMKAKRQWPNLTPLSFKPMASWTQNTFSRRRDLMQELQLQLSAMGRPDENPYWGSTRTYLTPIEENDASTALRASLTHLKAMQSCADSLSQRLMLSQPVTLQDIEVVCRAARRAEQAPKLTGVQLSTQDWQLRREALRELIASGAKMTDVRGRFDGLMLDVAWEHDLQSVRQALLSHGDKWWRFLSGEFKDAKRRLQSVAKNVLPKSSAEMLKMVEAVQVFQQHKKVYDQHETLGQALFGVQWQGKQSDWSVLERISAWVVNLHDDLGKGTIPSGIVDFLAGHSDASGLGEMVVAIEASIMSLQTSLGQVSNLLGLEQAAGRVDLRAAPLGALMQQLELWQERLPDLYHIARFNALAEKLRQESLGEFVDFASSCSRPELITASLELTWLSGLVQSAYAKNPTLQQFDRVQHELNRPGF